MVSGKRGWFYGWYFKCQPDTQTLAVIPAVHQTQGKKPCSIQIITEERSWTVSLPAEAFRRKGKTIFIGKNRFGERGVRLAVCKPGLRVKGRLEFGPLFPLKYDFMGPFSPGTFFGMPAQCMEDEAYGAEYSFDGAEGYWEGDRGRSFPGQSAMCGLPFSINKVKG